jgi:glycosyltransferase involved in cell wall biosynthesis
VKVLVVVGVYSGLAESLATGCWQPRGVPAVYRLLEGLAARQDLSPSYIFLSRDFDQQFSAVKRVAMAPLGDRVWILPWRRWPLFDRLKLGNMLREMEQALRVLFIAMRLRPDVAYCANTAFVGASLMARLGIAPVLLRFLGLFPVHREIAERRGRSLARWFFRAPFARAICTLEGSGAEFYLPKLLKPGVPYDILLNGVDPPKIDRVAVDALRRQYGFDGKPIIGFVGRLEPSKGCDDFVEALARLEALRPGSFSGLIVGDGSLRPQLERRVTEAGLSARVRFAGAVPHGAVAAYLGALDVYVSLNRFGNLSNANLEAMVAGLCMVVVAGEPRDHIDEATDRLVPASVVQRIPRDGLVEGLACALAGLLDQPGEIARRAAATKQLAATMLSDWNQRVAHEISLILAAAGVTTEQGSNKRAA